MTDEQKPPAEAVGSIDQLGLVERMNFAEVCALLPDGVNWGDSLTPKLAREIVESAVAAERERWRSAVIRRIPAHERFDDQRAAGNTCRAILRDCGA